MLQQWSADHWAVSGAAPGLSHSASAQRDGSAVHLPPPPRGSACFVPPLDLPPRIPDPPVMHVTSHPVAASPRSSMPHGYPYATPAEPLSSGRRPPSCRRRTVPTLNLPQSSGHTSARSNAPGLVPAPPTRPADSMTPACMSPADSPAHSSDTPRGRDPSARLQRRLLFSSAFHDPAARRAVMRDAAARPISGGRRSTGSHHSVRDAPRPVMAAGIALGGPGFRASADATPARVDAAVARRRSHAADGGGCPGRGCPGGGQDRHIWSHVAA